MRAGIDSSGCPIIERSALASGWLTVWMGQQLINTPGCDFARELHR